MELKIAHISLNVFQPASKRESDIRFATLASRKGLTGAILGRRTLADTPNLIAALYQRIEDAGGDTKQAEATIAAERAVLAVEAVRARADTSAPRTRYQWVGGADGDLFQVEDTETKPVERIELDDA